MTRKRRGRVKKEVSNLASNQFPMCSPLSGTPREVHRVTQKKKIGRKEIVISRRRGVIKRIETEPTP